MLVLVHTDRIHIVCYSSTLHVCYVSTFNTLHSKTHVLILSDTDFCLAQYHFSITPSYSVLECFLSSMALPVAKINY